MKENIIELFDLLESAKLTEEQIIENVTIYVNHYNVTKFKTPYDMNGHVNLKYTHFSFCPNTGIIIPF